MLHSAIHTYMTFHQWFFILKYIVHYVIRYCCWFNNVKVYVSAFIQVDVQISSHYICSYQTGLMSILRLVSWFILNTA